MRRTTFILRLRCGVAMVFVIGASALADENPLVALANAWTRGQPIPAELLTFRESDGCFAEPTDTYVAFDGITNYDLLRAIILHPCDERVFDSAVKRALSLVGPTRFFHDICKVYAATPQLLSQPRHRTVHARSALPHVLVDGLFIDDGDMPRDDANEVFARIAADLRAGVAFDAVQKKYWDAYEYAYTETLSDGSKVTLHRTRVGNYGDFVISERDHTARPFQSVDLPEQHVRPLLSGRTGDIIILRDETEHRSILYRVRDAYSPPA
jgi:hypothetical protein